MFGIKEMPKIPIHFDIGIIAIELEDEPIGICGQTNGLFTKNVNNISCEKCIDIIKEEQI